MISVGDYDFLKAERNGMVLTATLYDSQGRPISGVTQTTVGGESEIFYMSFKVKASNTGNVALSGLRIAESHPTELDNALQNQPALQPNLDVGESNILEWNTANSCSSDAQCGVSEKCVNTICLIDISNFLGEITFGMTLEADWLDAQGNPKVTSTLINLPILFEQDEVIFRTNSLGDFSDGSIELAVDRDDDGNLESYVRTSQGLGSYSPSDFITYTVQNNLVFKCLGLDNVCVSTSSGLNKDNVYASLPKQNFVLGGSIPLTKSPLEPYKSQNCNGVIPCQERYSTAVSPPEENCFDSTQNQDETDIDCGGSTCPQCDLGKTCLINDDCISDNCTGNLCTVGEEPTPSGDVIFRTTDLTYSSGGIAYSLTCGNTLLTFGYETGMSHSAYECENNANFNDCGTTCLIMDELPYSGTFGTDSSLSTTEYRLYQDDSDPDEVWICINDQDGDGSWTARYDRDKGTSSGVSDSSLSIDQNLERDC